jgi:hypothetical protein
VPTLRRAVGLSFVASLALLVASGPVAAAPKGITGKLSKRGYTVIALAANGKANAVRAGPLLIGLNDAVVPHDDLE